MQIEVEQLRPENHQGLGATHRSEFRVGGVSVLVSGQSGRDVALVPSLEPFRSDSGVSDVAIQVEWAERLDRPTDRALFDSGSLWHLYEDGADFQFDFSAPVLGPHPYKRLFVDRRFRQATLQMSTECFAGRDFAIAPLEYPLDELLIMHRLTQEQGIELHSCGIVRPDGTGNLFVGHSGAGKSTTTRLWTEREDDRIIVRRDCGSEAEAPFRAADIAGEHGILRLRDRSASPTGHFAQDDSAMKKCGMRMYGTPWHGEAMYASPGSAPLSRIFILEHGQGNVLTELSPSEAVAELFARSFVPFHRHEYVESALNFLQELVEAVPCYRYSFEPNEAAVERILEFRD